jgi:hypothetical protein
VRVWGTIVDDLFGFVAAFEEGGDRADEIGDRVEGFFGGGE